MSGRIYNKYLTFLKDQPFAESFLSMPSYGKRRSRFFSKRDSFLRTHSDERIVQSNVGVHSFGFKISRSKSEKMKKAEASLVKHFCLTLERGEGSRTNQAANDINHFGVFRKVYSTSHLPHLLVPVDSMRNTLLSTRTSRTTDRVRTPSQFKKILRECRKIRLLYGNLSFRHLSRATNKIRLPGENLLIWLESRLDVVLERCGFFASIKTARQTILNGKILVNSKIVRSPGFILEGGDMIKVLQVFTDPLKKQKQFSILNRGVILSNEVLVRSEKNKSLSFRVSKLPTGPIGLNNLNNKIGKGFNSLHGSVSNSYGSFSAWRLERKQKDFKISQDLSRQSKTLFKAGSQNKFSVFAEKNVVPLKQQVPLSQKWRFLGSPHLLFSLFYSNMLLKKITFYTTKILSEGILKKAGKHNSHKELNSNKTSASTLEVTQRSSESCLVDSYRGGFTLPTILSLSLYCAINVFGVDIKSSKKSKGGLQSNLSLSSSSLLSLSIEAPAPDKRSSPKQSFALENSLLDLSKAELFLHSIRESFSQKKKNGVEEKDTHKSSILFRLLHKQLRRLGLSKVTSNSQAIFDLSPSTSLNRSNCFFINPKTSRTFTQLGNTDLYDFSSEDHVRTVIEAYKNFFSTLRFTSFSNELKINPKVKLQSNPKINPKDEKHFLKDQKITQPRVRSSILQLGDNDLLKLLLFDVLLYSLFLKKESLRVQLKKELLDSRVKPLHIEVSYQSLSVIFLYPPQRVCLPVMVDVECLAKAF
jgi:ribosomal protein S4